MDFFDIVKDVKMRRFVSSYGWEMLSSHQTHVSDSIKPEMNAKVIVFSFFSLDSTIRSKIQAKPKSTIRKGGVLAYAGRNQNLKDLNKEGKFCGWVMRSSGTSCFVKNEIGCNVSFQGFFDARSKNLRPHL